MTTFCHRSPLSGCSRNSLETSLGHLSHIYLNICQKSLNGMSGDFLLRMPHPLSLLEPLESLSLSDPFQPLNKTVTPIPVDWRETAQAHVFEAELPGVKKENVKVQIQNGVLEIIGKQDKEELGDERDATWHSLERPVHHYGETRVRQLSLPADANVDEVKASMENGVLTVRIPKKGGYKSNVKNIEIEVVNKEGIGKKIVKSLKGIIAPAKAK